MTQLFSNSLLDDDYSYLKCIYIMINEGKGANGAQILKPETVEEMWHDQLAGKQPEKINALGRDIPNVRPDLTHVVSPYVLCKDHRQCTH